jgi:hypothetical protein
MVPKQLNEYEGQYVWVKIDNCRWIPAKVENGQLKTHSSQIVEEYNAILSDDEMDQQNWKKERH